VKLETLEGREVPAVIGTAGDLFTVNPADIPTGVTPLPAGAFVGTPDGTVGQLQAFLNPNDLSQLYNVKFAMTPGLAGRVEISTYEGVVVYNGFPFGDDARYGGTIAVIRAQPGEANRLAFGMPGAGAGPRVGILALTSVSTDPPRVEMVQSFFALDAEYRGGIKIQSCPEGMNGPAALLCLPGAGGGPVCTIIDVNTGVIKATVLAGPADDRSGDYHFPSQGSGVSSPYVDGVPTVWSFIVGRGYHAATATEPPRFDSVKAFSIDPMSEQYPIGADVTVLFDALKLD